jgi:putative flippase GtrA
LLLVLLGLFLLVPEHIPTLAQWVLTALIGNGAAYVAGNVLQKQTISKHYREELHDN